MNNVLPKVTTGMPMPSIKPPRPEPITIDMETMRMVIKSAMVCHKNGVTETTVNDAARFCVAALSGALKSRYPVLSAQIAQIIDCVDEADMEHLKCAVDNPHAKKSPTNLSEFLAAQEGK
jgi:hypothetical protein